MLWTFGTFRKWQNVYKQSKHFLKNFLNVRVNHFFLILQRITSIWHLKADLFRFSWPSFHWGKLAISQGQFGENVFFSWDVLNSMLLLSFHSFFRENTNVISHFSCLFLFQFSRKKKKIGHEEKVKKYPSLKLSFVGKNNVTSLSVDFSLQLMSQKSGRVLSLIITVYSDA